MRLLGGRDRRMLAFLALPVMAALLLGGAVMRPATAAALPSYSFVDVGAASVVGQPVAISSSGALATTKGIWRDGAFVAAAVPGYFGASPYVTDMASDGEAVGSPGVASGGLGGFFWDTGSGPQVQVVPAFPDTVKPNGEPCGGALLRAVDTLHEAGGLLTYLNGFSASHVHCTGGDTSQTGFEVTGPAGTDVRLDGLADVFDIQPGYAVGLDAGGHLTILNRATSVVTSLPTLDVPIAGRGHLASDGGLLAGLLSDFEAPQYRAPDGTVTALKRAADNMRPSGEAMNDSHAIVGESATQTLLWPTPASDPVALDGLPVIPADDTLIDALAIGDNGDVAGTFIKSIEPDNSNAHVYLLTAAPTLSASIALTGADGKPFTGGASAIGKALDATVTLKNSSLTKAITGIAVTPPMSVAPSASLTPSGPPPTVPTSLLPGESASYVVHYTVADVGHATLSLHAIGVEDGSAVAADAQIVARLGQPLAVSVAFEQDGKAVPGDTIKLKVTDDGEVPQDVTAVVTMTNVSKVTQQNVNFNGPMIASFHKASQAMPTVPVGVSGPTGDALPASMAAGATLTERFTLHVTNNGVFDADVQVLSGDAAGTLVSSGRGTLTVNPTALLWIKLHPVSDLTGLIAPGMPVLLAGTITNRSQTQVVDIDPLEPTIDGNAGGGGLADSSQPDLPDGVRLPLNGPLQPGSTTGVDTIIATAGVPGTRATITYNPAGRVHLDDGTEVALTPEQIGSSAGSGPFQLHFDQRDPVPPAATAGSLFWNFSGSAFAGASMWLAANLRAGADLLAHPVSGGVGAVKGVAKLIVASTVASKESAQLVGGMYLLSAGYLFMTPEQRGRFADAIVADFERSSLHVAHQALQAAADPILLKFHTAIATGDYNEVARMSGSGLATGAGGVADLLLADIAFQKLAMLPKAAKAAGAALADSELAKTISLAQGIRKAKLEGKLGKALPGIEAGDNLLLNGAVKLIDTYGLTKSQVQKLTAFCKKNRIVVALRSRSKRAAELIRKGVAVGKNLVIKLKNVDDIDYLFLGYRKADRNTVIWAEPITRAQFERNLARYKGLTKAQRIAAEERYAMRIEEWNNRDYHTKLNTWNTTKQIKLQFDGAGSGVGQLDAQRTVYRRFELAPVGVEGRYYRQLRVGNKPGRFAQLLAVTQDVDLVAILGEESGILAAEVRARAYTFLEDILGIQHPDTMPWIKNGEVLFEAKTKLLKDHVRGGEALAVFDPSGGVLAGFFNPSMTIFNTVTKGGYVFFEGAYNNPYAHAVTNVLVKLRGKG